MADARGTGRSGGSDVSPDGVGTDGAVSLDERRTALNRAVANLTREARAYVRTRTDLEAVLVRGTPVNHRLHLAVVAVLAVLALLLSEGLRVGTSGVPTPLLLPVAYAASWLFITLTGGEELTYLSVDARGKVGVIRTGRDVETRGEVAKAAILVIVIGVSGWFAVLNLHDVVFQPAPNCNLPASGQPDACFVLPQFGNQTTASASTAGSAVDAGTSGTTARVLGAYSVEQTKTLERLTRAFFVFVSLVVLIPAVLFLRPKLAGGWVFFTRRVRHRPGDE